MNKDNISHQGTPKSSEPAKPRSSNPRHANPVNRTKAVEVAAQLFLRQGYAYVSMDEVVRVSGVSKSNIYYHFKNRRNCFRRLFSSGSLNTNQSYIYCSASGSVGYRSESIHSCHCFQRA